MKFLGDMGISPQSVAFLNALGHEAVHLVDQGLGKLSDCQILEKARAEGRVLLTHDLDFGELVAASKANLPSVVVFRLRNMRPAQVNRYLGEVLARHGDALQQGAIVAVKEARARVRALPLRR